MIRHTFLTQNSSYVLSESSAHFWLTFAYFWFWIQRTKPNKDFTKLCRAKRQIWVKCVKRGERTLTYTPAFFLPLVFENSSQIFIWYSTLTSEFDPCALLLPGYCKCVKTILFGACSAIKKWLLNWLHFTLSIFIKLNVNYENINWVDTFFLCSVYVVR